MGGKRFTEFVGVFGLTTQAMSTQWKIYFSVSCLYSDNEVSSTKKCFRAQ
jgi:hypothetical protein